MKSAKKKYKLFRIAAAPESLCILLKGQLAYLNKYFDITGIASNDKSIENLAIEEGINIKGIEIARNISVGGDILSLIRLFSFFKKEKPLIIHSITPKAGLLSMIAGYFSGVPIRIHTFTGLIFPSRKGFMHWLLKNMDCLTCSFATHIIPEGEGVKYDLIRYNVTNKSLKVIGNGNVNGIDSTYFSRTAIIEEMVVQTRNTWHIQPNNFVYIFIGRLVKDKGINELVTAFVHVNKHYPHTKLLLVGVYEQKLDPLDPNTIDTISNQSNIIRTGFQTDIRSFLAVSNVLVFPSYREGFPNVPMQAGSMGLPSIVTNINGCNEIIQDDVNGIIIPPKDTSALENAMIELLENNEKREQLAQNARPLIVARYEQQMLWQLIKQEYDEQLKKANIIF